MRWVIILTLAYFSYGSIGIAVDDYRTYGRLFGEAKMAVVMAAVCLAGIVSLVFGWGL